KRSPAARSAMAAAAAPAPGAEDGSDSPQPGMSGAYTERSPATSGRKRLNTRLDELSGCRHSRVTCSSNPPVVGNAVRTCSCPSRQSKYALRLRTALAGGADRGDGLGIAGFSSRVLMSLTYHNIFALCWLNYWRLREVAAKVSQIRKIVSGEVRQIEPHFDNT